MLIEILVLPLLIMLNAFLAASEVALISVNENRIRVLAEKGNKRAIQLQAMLAEPSRFLATIQIGITLAGFMASAFAAESLAGSVVEMLKPAELPFPDSWLRIGAVVIITVVLSYFALVLGELAPKRLAMKKAEAVALLAVKPLHGLSVLAAPFVKLLSISTNVVVRTFGLDPYAEDEKITEDEIRLMVDAGKEKGAIQEDERQMIDNIFEFNDKTVADIMTHRTDILAFPATASMEEIISSINIRKYSRIPVYEGSMDNIVGVLYVKDIIQSIAGRDPNEVFDLKKIVRRPFFVPAYKKTDELLRDIKKNKTHMAIVIDEYGGTEGIVTLEDLIEEIVGDIFDEYDEEEEMIRLAGQDSWIIKGAACLETVQDFLGLELPVDEYETISGFVIGQLGRIPGDDEQQAIEYRGFSFLAEEVEAKRIVRVRVTRV